MFRACLLSLLAGAVVTTASGCKSNSTTPTTVEPASITVVWSSTLAVGASRFYSFSVPLEGTVSMQLKTLTQNGAATAELVTLGLGAPRGTDCAVSGAIAATGSDATLLAGIQAAGVYCIRIWDASQLSKPAAFSVTITHPKQ